MGDKSQEHISYLEMFSKNYLWLFSLLSLVAYFIGRLFTAIFAYRIGTTPDRLGLNYQDYIFVASIYLLLFIFIFAFAILRDKYDDSTWCDIKRHGKKDKKYYYLWLRSILIPGFYFTMIQFTCLFLFTNEFWWSSVIFFAFGTAVNKLFSKDFSFTVRTKSAVVCFMLCICVLFSYLSAISWADQIALESKGGEKADFTLRFL